MTQRKFKPPRARRCDSTSAGDASGGAALSVRIVGSDRFAFIAGRKIADFEHVPSRSPCRAHLVWANRTSSKSEGSIRERSSRARQKLLDGQFTLDDFLGRFKGQKSRSQAHRMMPGIPKAMKNLQIEERRSRQVAKHFVHRDGRRARKPELIEVTSSPHRPRVGSIQQVAQAIKQFLEMRRMDRVRPGWCRHQEVKAKSPGKGGKAGGGRVTPKGPAKVPKVDLSLPGLPGFSPN